MSRNGLILLAFGLFSISVSNGLKCRTSEESQPSEDFEYVVRMCLRQMKNASRHENMDRNFDNLFHRNRNWNQNRNKGPNHRNQADPEGFEYFWNPNSGRDKDREQRGDGGDRGKMENDYMEDSDYFHANPLRGMSSDARTRIRTRPHTYQQQIQHDRDTNYGYGHRDGPFTYQNSDRNKSGKRTSNKDRKGDSPLEQLDPCMIHCIFQEMQMLDENGKPDKNTVSEKMSQKVRNPELKSFIQDSVEECFEIIEEDAETNRIKSPDFVCVWSKNFAICLEDKGKESCDDWNEPIHRSNNNNNRDEQNKNKNKNAKGGNNRG